MAGPEPTSVHASSEWVEEVSEDVLESARGRSLGGRVDPSSLLPLSRFIESDRKEGE
jgi:hypothetical protein